MKRERGFVPIGIREHARLHAKVNPDETRVPEDDYYLKTQKRWKCKE